MKTTVECTIRPSSPTVKEIVGTKSEKGATSVTRAATAGERHPGRDDEGDAAASTSGEEKCERRGSRDHGRGGEHCDSRSHSGKHHPPRHKLRNADKERISRSPRRVRTTKYRVGSGDGGRDGGWGDTEDSEVRHRADRRNRNSNRDRWLKGEGRSLRETVSRLERELISMRAGGVVASWADLGVGGWDGGGGNIGAGTFGMRPAASLMVPRAHQWISGDAGCWVLESKFVPASCRKMLLLPTPSPGSSPSLAPHDVHKLPIFNSALLHWTRRTRASYQSLGA